MAKKLMIFGGGGFVGENMALVAKEKGWQVTICDCFSRSGPTGVAWQVADITKESAVEEVIAATRPDGVVNLAAIADVDKAEREKELARQVNVEGARNVATNCAKRRVKLVFFSSDAVFDGKGNLYTEADAPHPINYYGTTKAEAEKAVFAAHPGAIVVRISLVMGFPITGGNSFFDGLEKKLREGKTIPCPLNEVRTPVDVFTLSECVLELLESNYTGVMHIGATNHINRYELTKKVAKALGFSESLVQQSSGEPVPGRAPRHRNGIISVAKAQQFLKTRLLTVDEGISRAINQRRGQ
jgi:dTDP-4-dehydrorhamnose reductase